jgi:hypothetical protein
VCLVDRYPAAIGVGDSECYHDDRGFARGPIASVGARAIGAGATRRLLTRRGCDRRALLREVRSLIAADAQRKRRNRRPTYASNDTSTDAGPTEVDEPTEPAPGPTRRDKGPKLTGGGLLA